MSLRQIVEAFLFVSTRSARNRFLQKLGRLRQPRYALSAFVGLLYFAFVFGRNILRHGTRGPFVVGSAGGTGLLLTLGGMAVFLLMIGAWALPEASGGLTFAPAEIQFLFPAPLKRWQLLLYKVLRSQPQILFSSAIMTLLGFRQGHVLGVWATFTALNLYFIMVSMGRARLQLAGIGWTARLLGTVAVIAGVVLLIMTQYPPHAFTGLRAGLKSSHDLAVLSAVTAPFRRLPLAAIFLVPRFLVMASLPVDLTQLATAVAATLTFALISFLIATRLDVSFEEASVTASQKRAESRANRLNREGGRQVVFRKTPVPFTLRSAGRPEVAIFWKNLIALGRVSGRTFLVLLLASIAVVGTLAGTAQSLHSVDLLKLAGTMTLAFGAFFALFSPLLIRADLRLDQRRFDFLKTLPITGERLIAAELAAPLVAIVLAESIIITIGSLLLKSGEILSSARAFFSTPQFVIMALIFLTPVTAIQLLLHNAIVVLLPGWAMSSKEDMRGIAATGLRLVIMIGHLIALILVIFPAALVFLPSLWIAHQFFAGSAGSIVVATMPPLAVMAGELLLAVRFLGRQFDELDLANDVFNLESE